MMILGFTITFGWWVVWWGFAALGIIGTAGATVAWKGYQTWTKLHSQDSTDQAAKQQQEQDRQDRLNKEDSELRETLMARYKDMYELEKERSQREIRAIEDTVKSLKAEGEEHTSRYRQLKDDYEHLKNEYNKVVQLNVQYQETRGRDADEISRLKSELHESGNNDSAHPSARPPRKS